MSRIRTSVAVTAVALVAAGLPLVAATQASAAVAYLQWDFNSDGKADLAVGAPGEDVGTNADAGKVSVFMADPTSGTYHDATDWTQDMLGGAAEAGDQFGYAMTSGDFDGDGYADLAVAANRETIGSGATRAPLAGIVTIIWGSSAGLTTSAPVNLRFDVNGTIFENTFAGDALAAGDMDGDGKSELAVGGPGVELVKVYKGAAKASFGTTFTNMSEYSSFPGDKRYGDLFGETLAMGDFDNDGKADLAIGAPYDADDRGYSVGAVSIVPGGGTNGPDVAAAKRWTPDSAGISSAPHTFTVNDLPDSFGRTLAVGDFGGDSADDLAVGIPGSPVGGVEDAGAVNVLYGKTTTGFDGADTLITQESTGVPSASSKGGLFGASLDGGAAGSGFDMLAIGSAKEYVWVLKGASGTGSMLYTQNSEGVFGTREAGDAFGAFVRFLASDGTGSNDSLVVGSPGESYTEGQQNAGVVYVLPSPTNLPTGINSQKFEENDPGVAGSRESGDAFGWLGDSH